MKTTSTKIKLRNMGIARFIAIVLTLFSFGKVIAVPLSGTYTIGATGTYSTFALAVADLTTNGISGPVTFNVQAGTYSISSAISIGAITGASATNTITFEGTDPSTRIITGSISNSAMIVMNASTYMRWRNLTVTNTYAGGTVAGIAMVGTVNTVRIAKCIINIPIQTSTSSNGFGIIATSTANGAGVGPMSGDTIVIDSNIINGGGYAITVNGNASSTVNRGIQIRGNVTNSTNYMGGYIYNNYNPIDVLNNTFNMTAANYGYFGLYFYFNQSSNTTQSHNIIGNKILNFGGYGLYMYSPLASATAAKVKIYDNLIVGGNGSSYFGYYGVYFYLGGATYPAEVFHNTIIMNGAGATSTGYTGFYNTGSSNVMFKNNIFAVTAGLYTPLYLATSPTTGFVNYNNYYNYTNPTTGNLLYRGGFYTPATYKTATAGGDSSFNNLPSFVSIATIPGNYHLTDGCNGYGVDLTASVPKDIDDVTRSTTPNPGAYEFTGSVANNLFVTKLLTPAAPITLGAQDVKFIVKNIGSNTVTSLNASYKLNSGTPVTQAYSGSLATCAQDTMIFTGSNQATLGSINTLKVYTAAPNGFSDADKTNDTITTTLYAPLNGTYTVGGTTPDFATPAAAAAAAVAYGVGGPVKFDIRAGTYTTPVDISAPILGTSATNTVIFEGNSAATRIISASVAGGMIFRINGAKYVKVRNLTMTNTYTGGTCGGFAVIGNTSNDNGSNCAITKCVINLPVETTSSLYGYGIMFTGTSSGTGITAMGADSSVIDSNVINGGAVGICHYGASNATKNRGVLIRNNVTTNTNYYGGYISYNYNPIDLLNNTFSMNGSEWGYYGVYYFYNQSGSTTQSHNIIGNKVLNFGGYGLYLYYPINSAAAAKVKIYDNIISSASAGPNPGYYGVYFYQAGAAFQGEVYHNTIVMNGAASSTTYTGFYNTGSSATIFKNNIFAVTAGTSTPLYLATNPTGNVVNYNNYYNYTNPTSGTLLYRGGFLNPSNYKTATGGGDSSFNVQPSFVSVLPAPGNYHLTDGCNGYGVDLTASVPTDIDNNVRSTTPNPGAYEFSGGVADNLYVTTLLTPVAPITLGAQDLKFIVKNIGNNTVYSLNAAYKLNSNSPVIQAYTGTLAACAQDTITFTGSNQITLTSNNNLKVYSSAPNGNSDADKTNDTISTILYAPLNGVYTVGGTTPDFATPAAAAAAAVAYGVAGPVKFDIRAGTYNGQVIISGPVLGTSPTNTVTFEGNSNTTRIITTTTASAAAVIMNGCKYVKFRNLTINNLAVGGAGVGIVGNASNNNGTGCAVSNCIINMPNAGTSTSYGFTVTGSANGFGTTNNNIDSITIDSNVINGGYYGLVMYGNTSGSAAYNRNHKIRGNTVIPSYYYGVYLYYIYNQLEILNNTITYAAGNTVGYGMYIFYCQNNNAALPTRIIGNKVDGAAYMGYYLYFPTGTAPLEISNNVVSRLNYAYTYGMYLYATSSSDVKILHNTLILDYAQTSNTYAPLYAYLPSNSIIKNNIFACTATSGSQIPLYLASGATAASAVNYNLYYNAANTGLLYRTGTTYTTANFNTTTAGGDSSFNANPMFVSASNFAVQTCYTGVDLTSIVPVDINGVTRNVPPKIGAYENTTPLSYVSSSAIQKTGAVGPGTTDAVILRIPVALAGCGNALTTQVRFNTIGTTSVSNIIAAKLYKTGTSATFTNTNLLGTVYSPSGQFSFTINDTINRNAGDTANYWLAYDISASAAVSNLLDARIDSINTVGAWRIPSSNNPAGSRIVTAPMTYLSSTSLHPTLSTVQPGTTDNQLLRIRVIGSSTGSPINVTQFSLNTNGGGRDTLNIASSKIYYTGNSTTFNTSTVFGTYTVPSPSSVYWPSYTITGLQPLQNDTNYFWLVYNLKSGAVLGDSVDAEVTDITVNGVTQYPTVTAPFGNRRIRAPYCLSAATSTADEDLWGITFGTLNNTSTCSTTGGPGSTQSLYSDYTATVAAPSIPAGVATPLSIYTGSCGGNYGSTLGVYIDYNQDGLFTGTGESVYTVSFTSSTGGIYQNTNVTIPCTATAGLTRMRIVFAEQGTAPSCGTYTWGETEDYMVNIVSGPASFTAAKAIQITGSTTAGSTDVPILRLPVKAAASTCNPGLITEVRLNTTGTSVVSNIIAAKLYKTTGNTFNTTNLLSTLYSPSGVMVFSISDTAVNDTNNYWLAYDVSSSALNGATLDAKADSVLAFGSYGVFNPGNPTGNRVVAVPATYVSSTASHPDLGAVDQGSTNNRILLIPVTTSATGAPINLTRFDLSTLGSASPSTNITNAKVFYTGSSNTFTSTTQFGTTSTSPSGSFTVLGSQALLNGVNYFWVTYDIPATATLGDSVDAVVTGLTVDGTSQTPSVTSPAGNRKIRAAYCIPVYTAGCTVDDITRLRLVNLDNLSGCSGVYNFYNTATVPTLYQGGTYAITINYGNDATQYGMAWIDYNNDGTFSSSEALPDQYPLNPGFDTATIYFTVPTTTNLGNLRLRIRGGDDVALSTTQACGASNSTYGEGEDYIINVAVSPLITYVWTGTTSTDAAVPTNWNPSRFYPNISDKLMFNTGTTINTTNVSTTQVRAVELANVTLVNLAGFAGNTIMVSDSLILGTGSRVNTGTLNVQVGISTVKVGTLTGAGRVTGNLIRWINATNTTPSFPMADNAGVNRNVTLNYTTLPTAYGTIKTSFVSAVPGNTGLPLTDALVVVKRAGINGYWNLATTTTGGAYTGTFNGTGFNGVANYTGLRLINRATTLASWGVDGIHVATTGTNAAPILSRTGMSAYGQYGIGGDTLVNPLPVSLMFFNAKNVNGDVMLNWSTASETNNKGFMVERSIDGNNFVEVAFVKGSGNTKSITQYSKEDMSAFAKAGALTLYYRLKQIDFDGVVTYSTTAIVNEQDVLTDEVKVFPNPFVNNIGVKIEAGSNTVVEVQLIDMQGRVISTDVLSVVAGSSTYHDLKNVSSLANGVYFVKVSMNGVSKTTKVTKAN